jgi:hypothetical protein
LSPFIEGTTLIRPKCEQIAPSIGTTNERLFTPAGLSSLMRRSNVLPPACFNTPLRRHGRVLPVWVVSAMLGALL